MTFIERLTKPAPRAVLLLLLILTNPAFAAPERQTAFVVEAITGDLIKLQGGKTFRYAGVDAPALQSIIPLAREYGQGSLEFNQALTAGQKIHIEWDSQIRDKRGNLLGYAFLDDGTFVNERVLHAGWAKTLIVAPNTRYAGRLRAAELDARRNKRGIWREEPENPYLQEEFIGEKNTKIYYLPTSAELSRIPQAQLVKFRSRIAAKAAGYRACDSCREKSADADESAL